MPESPPNTPQPSLVAEPAQRANQQIQQKDYEGAISTLESALRDHPDQAELHYHLAFAYWYRASLKPDGKLRRSADRTFYRKAIAEFEAFLRQTPGDPRAGDARVRLDILRRVQLGQRSNKE